MIPRSNEIRGCKELLGIWASLRVFLPGFPQLENPYPRDEIHDVTASRSLRADVSYFLPPAEKGRLRNGVANRVPVSCCSDFKFRINYDNRVLFSVPETFPSDRSMIGGRTGLRGGI